MCTRARGGRQIGVWVCAALALLVGACTSAQGASDSAGTTTTAVDTGCPAGTSLYARDVPRDGGAPPNEHETWCATDAGVATGPYHRTDMTGAPRVDGTFAQSVVDGTWRYWDSTATFVYQERNYQLGVPHGTWTTWTQKDVLANIHQWAYGRPCGDWQLSVAGKLIVNKSWPACASIQPVVPDVDAAPETTDYGWDGQPGSACAGTVEFENTSAGEAKYCVDAGGVHNGPVARWHPGSHARWVDGFYVNNTPAQTWRTWFPTGGLEVRGSYEAGQKTGVWQTWHSDGTPDTRETWVAGVRDGSAKAWFPGGVVASSGSYSQGVQVGAWATFWPTGTPNEQATYDTQGRLDGAFQRFFDSGLPDESGAWDHGVRTGVWTSWYASGAVAKTGSYVGGIPEGKWHYNMENGDPDSDVIYVHGVGNGATTIWHRDNGVMVRTTFQLVDGVAQGPAVGTYDVSGHKQATWTYLDGMRDGAIAQWHDNGQQALDGWFWQGAAHGLWRSWYENGQKLEEANFLFGNLQGAWADWYENGHAKSAGPYVKDQKEGGWQTWYADGKPQSAGSYAHGIQQGTWDYWTADGQHTTVVYDDWGNPKP